MTTTNGDQVVEGHVEGRNDRGIKVAGEWRNLSKFHPLDLPNQGARVRVILDNKDFIKSIDLLEGAPAAVPSNRDRTITRLAVLKAASNFLGLMSQCREEVRSEHVLVLADKWLAWVEQDPEK
jgi:hypothetical protein